MISGVGVSNPKCRIMNFFMALSSRVASLSRPSRAANGTTAQAREVIENRGVLLVLSALPSKVQDILQITQLIAVFERYDNAEQALQSLGERGLHML
jgi:hypothetical protein